MVYTSSRLFALVHLSFAFRLVDESGTVNEQFGWSCSVSDSTAVISKIESAIVFVWDDSDGWSQNVTLVSSDGVAGDLFGADVDMDGDYIVIGAYGDNTDQGSAYVFFRSGSSWNQQVQLLASDGVSNNWFGAATAIDGDSIVVGALASDLPNPQQGSAYVFTRTGTLWGQQAKLLATGGANGDNFGTGVGISGNSVISTAPGDDVASNGNQGSAYVFLRTGSSWSQQAQLVASDGAAGDYFGISGDVSGDYAVVGADGNSASASFSGAAYVYMRSGSLWSQQAKLFDVTGVANQGFGYGVDIEGDYLIASAWTDTIGSNANQGSAFVYQRSGTLWNLLDKIVDLSGGAADNYFGSSVSMSSTALNIIVGAYKTDIGANTNQGAAFASYMSSSSSWTSACPAGTVISIETCYDCGVGTYNELIGQFTCTECVAGKYNGQMGSTSSSACMDCAVDYYSPGGDDACTACGSGDCTMNMTAQATCVNCDVDGDNDDSGSMHGVGLVMMLMIQAMVGFIM